MPTRFCASSFSFHSFICTLFLFRASQLSLFLFLSLSSLPGGIYQAAGAGRLQHRLCQPALWTWDQEEEGERALQSVAAHVNTAKAGTKAKVRRGVWKLISLPRTQVCAYTETHSQPILVTECPAISSTAQSHDSPPQAPLCDGGRVQLVQWHCQLRPEFHLLHLDLLPAGWRRQGGGISGRTRLGVCAGRAGFSLSCFTGSIHLRSVLSLLNAWT